MKISALWITKNEEENIRKSIKSVAAITDELIVVDTGSTDGTIRIAEESGAKVRSFDWVDDFSAARNFALKQASGDVIIFLDADEWFSPALDGADRDEIFKIFKSNKFDCIYSSLQSINESGGIINTIKLARIYYRRNKMHFAGRIHEQMVRADGGKLIAYLAEKWMVKHTGYAESKAEAKAKRNIGLMEAQKSEKDEMTTLDKFYMLREYSGTGRNEEAYAYFDELLHSKKKISEFADEFPTIAPLYFYLALSLANAFRSKISRKDIYVNVAGYMKKLLPDYPGTACIELYYMSFFEHDDKKYLAALEEYEQGGAKRGDARELDDAYKARLPQIYGIGAMAHQKLGNKEAAMGYALKAITSYSNNPNINHLLVFTKALKGADEGEIILLLNKLIQLIGGGITENFLEFLMYEELKNVYLYFFKKQYDAGKAKKTRFLYLKILNGDSEDAIETAINNRAEMKTDDFTELVFCAVICAEDKALYEKYKEYLGKYDEISEAYFENATIDTPDLKNVMIYINEYRNIIFAAGKDTGDRFLSIFANNPFFRLSIKGGYYMDGGLYDEFLTEESYVDIYGLELSVQLMFIKCYVNTGRYEQALEILKWILSTSQVNYEIVNNLFVISEKASGDTRSDALRLHEEYLALLDELIDIEDVINTGVVFDDFTKKEIRALAALSPQEFKKQMFSAVDRPHEILLDKYMAVSEIYIGKEMYGMAQKYLRKLLVSGYKTSEVYGKLSEVFGKLGNQALAAELALSQT